MTEDIRVYQAEMPARVKGFTTFKDGYYTIMINSILERKQQLKIYEHELNHIKNRDFEKDIPVDVIEYEAHKKIPPR